MWMSFSTSPSSSRDTGIPVHVDTTAAMSSSSTSSFTIGVSVRSSRSASSFSSSGRTPYWISATRARFPARSSRSASMRSSSIWRLMSATRCSDSFSRDQRAASSSRTRLRVRELALERLAHALGLVRHRGELDLELAHAPVGLVELDGRRVDLHAQARRRLVHEVDRLVGEEAVGDVAVGEHRRGDERGVADLDAVVRLVALLQPAQDRDRVGNAGLADEHRLEAPLERRVLLDVLAVLVERRRADRAQLAAREHRLEEVRGVDGTLRSARADDRVQLVDEEDDVAGRVLDLREDRLEPLLELAAVLRPGEERADVERPHALALQPLGHVARDDPLREPLGDRRLPHAGLADEHRVVLRAPREDLHDAADLLVAADDGIELAGLGERGEIATVLLERLVRALGILRGDLLSAPDSLERLEQLVARDDVEREQEVLDRDELVAELAHLVEGAVEDAAEPRRRLRLPAAGDARQLREARLRLGAQRSRAVAGAVDERPRELLVEERERQMVGRELGIAGAARELLRGGDRLLALECQLLKVHVSSSEPGAWPADTARPRACRSGAPPRSRRAARARGAPSAPVPCCSSSWRRSTCSTPARLRPSSVVSRWMSRSRSTSASE